MKSCSTRNILTPSTLTLSICRSPKDIAIFFTLISFLLSVLVVGIWYTIQNCRKLARTVRGEKEETRQVRVDAAAVDTVTTQLRNSSQKSHQQLGEELQSMQQLQLNVASQLVEIKSVLSQYAAMQQGGTGGNNTKQD